MSVAQNLNEIKTSLPPHCQLVAVTKTHDVGKIKEAYDAGHRVFGENKVQELVAKYEQMPPDIQWHLIGHLQSNKVKFIVPFVTLIHGVDSVKLLQEINKQATKIDRVVDCLLQVHIAKEETKFGFDDEEIIEFFRTSPDKDLAFVNVRGLMGMATFTDNTELIRQEFKHLKKLFDEFKRIRGSHFDILSMGMSSDFRIAIEEGSTLVRVGSAIFGQRNYNH